MAQPAKPHIPALAFQIIIRCYVLLKEPESLCFYAIWWDSHFAMGSQAVGKDGLMSVTLPTDFEERFWSQVFSIVSNIQYFISFALRSNFVWLMYLNFTCNAKLCLAGSTLSLTQQRCPWEGQLAPRCSSPDVQWPVDTSVVIVGSFQVRMCATTVSIYRKRAGMY